MKNSDIAKIKVSYFKDIYNTIPKKDINIWDWLLSDQGYSELIQKIRLTKDDKKRKELKTKLPLITPSGICKRRRIDDMTEHSGLICIDIDGKENPIVKDFEELKQTISKFPYILYCGLSVSGNGLMCLIPIKFTDKHKEHFESLIHYFERDNIIIDISCSDVSRSRFLSMDEKPYINYNVETYSDYRDVNKPVKIKSKPQLSYEDSLPYEKPTLMELEDYFLKSTIEGKNIQCKVDFESKTIKLKKSIDEIIEQKIDVTYNRKDWFGLSILFARRFRINGRQLFHDFSQFHQDYLYEECDEFYTKNLQKKEEYKYSNDWFFSLLQRKGLNN